MLNLAAQQYFFPNESKLVANIDVLTSTENRNCPATRYSKPLIINTFHISPCDFALHYGIWKVVKNITGTRVFTLIYQSGVIFLRYCKGDCTSLKCPPVWKTFNFCVLSEIPPMTNSFNFPFFKIEAWLTHNVIVVSCVQCSALTVLYIMPCLPQ